MKAFHVPVWAWRKREKKERHDVRNSHFREGEVGVMIGSVFFAGTNWEGLGLTGTDWEGLGLTGTDWEGLGLIGTNWEGD
jgi:uncharacterized protein YjbI with pentapeptide repeats